MSHPLQGHHDRPVPTALVLPVCVCVCLPVCVNTKQKRVPEKSHFFKRPSSKNCFLSHCWTFTPLPQEWIAGYSVAEQQPRQEPVQFYLTGRSWVVIHR